VCWFILDVYGPVANFENPQYFGVGSFFRLAVHAVTRHWFILDVYGPVANFKNPQHFGVGGFFRLEQDGRKCAGLFWTFMSLSPILKTPNTSVLGVFFVWSNML
jgi:hypothetical protein